MQALMEALKQLSDDDDRVFDLSIHLISETDEPFSWWTLGDINTAVAGQLMPLSLWLFAKGILLKDEEFEWVGQCREDA
ncbi:hypothetical protein CALCODRAFT_498952 [Calocera cornea HHB12733]|uniref:Uncharacterized protein n=1 Tax=Calocera cornea HHB12733 TaxID=1353952 RepID=A0A165EM07_9BASI|nr:hypothetical protein CALCODRAFT_498952 [Calocera cornea HHB12733]